MNDSFKVMGGPICSPTKCDSGETPELPKIVERLFYNVSECEQLSISVNNFLEKLGVDASIEVAAPSELKSFGLVGELERVNNRLIVLREVMYQVEAKFRKLI